MIPRALGGVVAQAWILQCNPDRYDIEGALEHLNTIRWRVPQRTGEIMPGDPVVLWRSGDQAGIVGIGRIVEPPHEAAVGAEEQPFDRGDGHEVTTRATVRVVPTPFVDKASVATIPGMEEHQILTAPMGTVFPIDEEQWSALLRQLPDPPEVESATPTWPAVFAWEQRTKSMNPLPGGIDAYQQVLADILGHVEAVQPARDELNEWVSQQFQVSSRRGELVVGFVGRAGLLRLEPTRVQLTPDGQRWLSERDPAFLLGLVHARVRYVGEMLAALDTPQSPDALLRHANDAYGMRWATGGQITRRRQLLGGVGAIELDDEGRIARTAFGHSVLERLDLATPREPSTPKSVEPPPQPESVESPPPVAAPPEQDHGYDLPTSVDRIVTALHDTAHASKDPDAFECAVRDAFDFLGFDAVWYGGAGRTDVLLTASLGAQQYRVVVDAKTTAHEAVGDQQIDWVTIDEHQDRYDADHAAVVAPAFRGSRVTARAQASRSVALIDVSTLTEVVRQHAAAPLGLDAYRALFDPNVGVDNVIEDGETLRRRLILATEILRQVAALEGGEGAVTDSDLYWNLDQFAEQFDGQRAERAEIAAICDTLAKPPLSLLRLVDDGYNSLGARSIQTRRLRLLAELIEQGVPETDEP